MSGKKKDRDVGKAKFDLSAHEKFLEDKMRQYKQKMEGHTQATTVSKPPTISDLNTARLLKKNVSNESTSGNFFSNDGSFMEQFRKLTRQETGGITKESSASSESKALLQNKVKNEPPSSSKIDNKFHKQVPSIVLPSFKSKNILSSVSTDDTGNEEKSVKSSSLMGFGSYGPVKDVPASSDSALLDSTSVTRIQNDKNVSSDSLPTSTDLNLSFSSHQPQGNNIVREVKLEAVTHTGISEAPGLPMISSPITPSENPTISHVYGHPTMAAPSQALQSLNQLQTVINPSVPPPGHLSHSINPTMPSLNHPLPPLCHMPPSLPQQLPPSVTNMYSSTSAPLQPVLHNASATPTPIANSGLALVTNPSMSTPVLNLQHSMYNSAPPQQVCPLPTNPNITLHTSPVSMQTIIVTSGPIQIPPPVTLVTTYSTAPPLAAAQVQHPTITSMYGLMPVSVQNPVVPNTYSHPPPVPTNVHPPLPPTPFAPSYPPPSTSVAPPLFSTLAPPPGAGIYDRQVNPNIAMYGSHPGASQPTTALNIQAGMYTPAPLLNSTQTPSVGVYGQNMSNTVMQPEEMGMYGPIVATTAVKKEVEEYDPAAPTDDTEGADHVASSCDAQARSNGISFTLSQKGISKNNGQTTSGIFSSQINRIPPAECVQR